MPYTTSRTSYFIVAQHQDKCLIRRKKNSTLYKTFFIFYIKTRLLEEVVLV